MSKLTAESVMDQRGIRSLIHFTRVENLESILRNGIVPRRELEGRTPFVFNDRVRLDGRTDCSSFTEEYPNSCLFNAFRCKAPGTIWAVLELDARKVLATGDSRFYCYDNAARTDIRERISQGGLTEPWDFESMFSPSYVYYRSYASGIVCRDNIRNIRPYLPTSIQAEILIPGRISPERITCIHFQSIDQCGGFLRSVSDKRLFDRFDFNGNGDAYYHDRNHVVFNREV